MKLELTFLLFLFSCNNKLTTESTNDVRLDVRLGKKFYSIYVSKEGDGYGVRGIGSYFVEPLVVEKSDTSKFFRLDSAKLFFDNLEKYERQPFVGAKVQDAPRIEIYYLQKKIYDSYRWGADFWDLVRPIMYQIPKGYNPFLANDETFHF